MNLGSGETRKTYNLWRDEEMAVDGLKKQLRPITNVMAFKDLQMILDLE